jgi:hypothetical protein
MTITLHETKGQRHRMQIEGDKSLDETVQLLRGEWRLQPWIAVAIERVDWAMVDGGPIPIRGWKPIDQREPHRFGIR